MKRFFGKIGIVVSFIIVLYGVLFYLGYKPLFTNSESFDAKFFEVNRLKLKQVDMMVIGSSVALNEISSKVMMDKYGTSYHNFGAWGLQMSDTYRLLKYYILKYHPKYVVLPSGIFDFNRQPNNTIPADLSMGENLLSYYVKNFAGIKELRERKYAYDVWGNDSTSFTSLKYDNGGGALLYIQKKNVSQERINEINDFLKNFPNINTPIAYANLNNIARLLKQNNIKLFFIQMPCVSSVTIAQKKNTVVHINKCKAIVEGNGGIYLNYSNDLQLSDSLFVDPMHLSARGATILTKQIVADIAPFIH